MSDISRRTIVGGALLGASMIATGRVASQTPAPGNRPGSKSVLPQPQETIDLWPKGAPGLPAGGLEEAVQERSTDPSFNDRAVMKIARPHMAVFRAAKPNGAAVIITPGGGYSWVVVDKEGYEVAPLLAARGITVFVLFYRLPHEGWAAGPDVCLSDAQRAMRIVRSRAAAYGIDPERVAFMGFSAGGHLCADVATRFDATTYDPVDAADRQSARPFLAAPIYPVISMTAPASHGGSRKNLLGATPTAEQERAHSPHRNVPANAPPCFLVHAEDDATVPVENSLLFRQALRDKGIRVETHLFTEGGHGFGVNRAKGKPAAIWPELFLNWAASQKLFEA
ncbi:alpha/beta hydrolase [Sphingobium sp. SCG-1]|uniref:alpha/beta hydrolase n=1 Tax=Sphingobium sp. SCG-1 TaxID=2072936 RepID=UPI000CD6C4BD|nr:alpha/beta hydrolase [Sphingobium sp. SCG-1]AUW57055.1 alpha/beta hydrolase [Sphingobium sp. SCG-1]